MPAKKSSKKISRRSFLQSSSLAAAGLAGSRLWLPFLTAASQNIAPLAQFNYGDVTLASDLHEKQFRETQAVLMSLSEDSLLKPLREMAGQPAPGAGMGGWYLYDPNYDYKTFDAGFAPGATFGQWVSALARGQAFRVRPAYFDFHAAIFLDLLGERQVQNGCIERDLRPQPVFHLSP